jgi:hypothetical protein
MSTSNVAGAICLYLSLNPGRTLEQVLVALGTTASTPPLSASDRNCGLEGNTDFPNQAYGWGRIDIGKAMGVN